MDMIRRHSALAFAVILMLIIVIANYLGGPGAIPKAPVLIVAPTTSLEPTFTVKTHGHKITAARKVVTAAVPREARGARLRDKGEAMGGGTPNRVDMTTTTLAAQ